MKKANIITALGVVAMALGVVACTEPEPVVKPHKPSDKVDVSDSTLPQAGGLEKFSFKEGSSDIYPAKDSYYYPIEVEVSTKDAATRTWTKMKTRVLANLAYFTPKQNLTSYATKTNKYGSSLELPRQVATGRFYVKKIGERWWLVDPEGYLHHHRGVNSVRPGSSDRNKTAFNSKFGGDKQQWLSTTRRELANIGIHSSGAFSSDDNYKEILKYNKANPESPIILCPSFGFLSAFEKAVGNSPDGEDSSRIGLVLHQNWDSWCKTYVNTTLAPYKGDPNTIAYFSDNEIPFEGSSSGNSKYILVRLLSLNTSHYAYQGAVEWCKANGVDHTNTSKIYWATNQKFAGYLAEKYYSAVSAATKAFDSQLLYFGTRLHGEPKANQYILAAAGKYCDVVSINYYGKWTPQIGVGSGAGARVSEWEKWSGKPFIVTEFYTKGIEDSDLSNMSGAGFAVRNQAARAYAYQHFTLGLLQATNCVGWHWFKYQDDDGSDNDGKPANKGLFDNNYTLFPYLGRYVKNLNIHTYDLIEFFDSL